MNALAHALVAELDDTALDALADFPYGVARQLYEPVVAAASESERRRRLSGAAGLVRSLMGQPAQGTTIEGEDTFARLHGLYWLFANLAAEGPVVVLVDDAQWADDTSLRFLGFLARRARELRLTLVVATRPARPGRRPLLRDLISDPAALKLHPAPLSAAAVAAWIAADVGKDADGVFAEACREATDGYPFFVRELLHEIRTEEIPLQADAAARVRELGPEGVASVMLVRLAGLPPAAAALARALATLGDGADLHVAGRLATLADDEIDTAVDGLSWVDLLEPGPPVRFVHPDYPRRNPCRDSAAGALGLARRRRATAAGRWCAARAGRGASPRSGPDRRVVGDRGAESGRRGRAGTGRRQDLGQVPRAGARGQPQDRAGTAAARARSSGGIRG
jgi:hypothetical protein